MDRIKKIFESDRLVLLLLLAAASLSLIPLFLHISDLYLNDDFLQLCMRHAFFRKSVLEFGQFPFRSPYIGGGYPILGDPEDPSLSPFTLLTLVFGEAAGLKLIAALVFLSGTAGMFLLARKRLGYGIWGVTFSTLTLAFCGWFHLRVAGGNFNELYYFITPLLLFLFLELNATSRFYIPLVILTACIGMDGKAVFLIVPAFLMVYIALETIYPAPYPARWRVWRNFLFYMDGVALVGAVKMVPVGELFLHKGVLGYTDIYTHSRNYSLVTIAGYTWSDVIKGLLIPSEMRQIYIGVVPVLMFLAALVLDLKRNWRFGVIFAVFTLLCVANNSGLDLFGLLWKLPFLIC